MEFDLSKACEDNHYISKEAIEQRYQASRKYLPLVIEGDFESVKQIIDSAPRDPNIYLDFAARNPNNAEENLREVALITNTMLHITLLSTQVPFIVLHGISTHFGRTIRSTSIDQFISGELFYSMFRSYCEISREFNRERYSPTVDSIVNYIFYNLQNPITLGQIAEALNFSPAYINRLLKKETGYSTVQYIKQKRISLAKTLLKLSNLPLEDVAISVGYMDYNYFCRVFKQVENMSPAQYRESLLN